MHLIVKEFINDVPLEDFINNFKKDHSEAISLSDNIQNTNASVFTS